MSRRSSQSTTAALLLLVVVAVWGSTFALVKDALADASPFVFNLLRMLVASVTLVAVHRRSLRGAHRHALYAAGVAGCLLGAGYQLQTAGLALTSAANSAFITGLVVVFVPLLSLLPALRSARVPAPGPSLAIGALFAVAGFYLMTTPGGSGPLTMLRQLHTGDLLTLGCALAFAAHLLSLSHFASVPAGQLATLQILACTVLMAVTLPLGGPVHLHISGRLITALLITGVLATAFAFFVQSWAQQHLAAGRAALLLTLEPVFALVVSFFFLGERPSARSLTGAACILSGLVLTELLASQPVLPPEPI